MRAKTFLALIFAGAVGVACGGASSSGLFDGPTTGGSDLDAGLDSGTVHHGGDEPDGATGAHDAGGNGGDTGGGVTPDAGSAPDTGVVIDAGPPTIEAGPPADPGVYCGEMNGNPSFCKVGTACCVKSNGSGGGGGSTCETPSVPFCSGVTIECDDDNDCNGQICCGTLINNNRYTSVRCSPTCDTQTDTQVHFCDLDAHNDVCAAEGLQCTASTLLPGYARCE